MATTEIRLDANKTVLPAAMLLIFVGSGILFSFFSAGGAETMIGKIVSGLCYLAATLFIIHLVRKLMTQGPTIVLSDDGITIHKRKLILFGKLTTVNYRWSEIAKWTVGDSDDESGYELVLYFSSGGDYRLGINLLEKSPDELRGIIDSYKKQT